MPGENIQDWSTTAANNATADSSIGWAEGMARASVNNSARSMMAAHAKDRNLKNGSITTSGTANAQTVSSGLSYTSVPTGLRIKVKIGAGLTNTAAATLNLDSIGAVSILDQIGSTLYPGALFAGSYADLLYNGTNWILLNPFVYYAEGSWTPALTFATAGNLSVTYSTQVGRYTRTGNLVRAGFDVATTAFTHTTASGALKITGLPFASTTVAGIRHIGALLWGGITKAGYTSIVAEIQSSNDSVDFVASASGASAVSIEATDCSSGGTMNLHSTIVYQV